ncbi:hypothetical protein GCM10027418_27820 [Mariniluteicoccus endophyticus]
MRTLLPLLLVLPLAACGQQTGSQPSGTQAPATQTPATQAPATSQPDEPTSVPPAGDATVTPTPRASGGPAPKAMVKGTLVDYRPTGDAGAEVRTDADADRLGDAPADFRAYLKTRLAEQVAEVGAECRPSVGVTLVDTRGFATGNVSGCGGAAVAWAKVDGTWREVWGGQELAPCGPFREVRFPAEVFREGLGASCFDNGQEVTYAP